MLVNECKDYLSRQGKTIEITGIYKKDLIHCLTALYYALRDRKDIEGLYILQRVIIALNGDINILKILDQINVNDLIKVVEKEKSILDLIE